MFNPGGRMKKSILAGALMVFSAGSFADENNGFYISANLGQATYDVSKDDLDEVAVDAFESAGAIVLDGTSSFDDKGTPWSVVGGYRFSQYFGAEVGYLNLGKAQYRSQGEVIPPGSATVSDATLDIDLSAKGPTLALVGFLPLHERFDLQARAGVFFADTTFDVAASIDGSRASDDFSADSQDFYFGIGATFYVTSQFALALDYTKFKDVGDEDETGEADVDSITGGIIYRF
jgi:OmpA-OmpF porin, OOP family